VNRDAAIELLDCLHLAQNEFYAGGSGSSFSQILTSSITWTIPGNNDTPPANGVQSAAPIGSTPTGIGDGTEAPRNQVSRLRQDAAEDGSKLLRVAHESSVAPWEIDQRSSQAFGKRDRRPLGEFALGGRSPGDYEPGRRRL